MTTGGSFRIDEGLTLEEANNFVHEVLSPAIYKYGSGSYYSESEYSMDQWQQRIWDDETYAKLLDIKQTWDPEHVFGCRHCVGDEEEPVPISLKTLPSWRYV